ncbi:MAG: hypothetical protein AB8C46_01160 [Burkholderiaceae bacterium]
MSGKVVLNEAFFERWRVALAADAEAAVRGHRCTLELCLYWDDTPWMISIKQGALAAAETGPWHMRIAGLTMRASAETWQTFWQPVPPPGFHDLMAMSSYGHCRIEGNIELMRTHLGFIKSLMAAPRQFIAQGEPAGVVS